MAWTSVRNININESTAQNRAMQTMIRLKEVLDANGWTLVGAGDGVDDSDWNTGGVTDPFPTYPSVTGTAADAWMALESNSGAQLVFQVTSAGDMKLWWSPSGSYTNDGISPTKRVGATTPPSDEVTHQSTNIAWGGTAVHYVSICHSGDGESFVLFGKRGSYDEFAGAFCLLDFKKTADAEAFWAYWCASDATNNWEADDLANPATGTALSYHPTSGQETYCGAKLEAAGVDPMDNMVADPNSSNEQGHIVPCVCVESGSFHFRGFLNGIMRISGLRSTGDTFDSQQYMCVGDFAIDGWNSADALS